MRTALHYAVEQGHSGIVKLILDAGINLSFKFFFSLAEQELFKHLNIKLNNNCKTLIVKTINLKILELFKGEQKYLF